MGETLEYLESLYEAGDYDELENCGECLADWGISIEADTPIRGRFASKAEYEPYAQKKLLASLKKSESLKAYWKDVKTLQELTGNDIKTVRRYLSRSVKYLAKKGKKVDYEHLYSKGKK